MLSFLTAAYAAITANPVYLAMAVSMIVNLLGALLPAKYKAGVLGKLVEFSQHGGPNVLAALKAFVGIMGAVVDALRVALGAPQVAANAKPEDK